MMKGLRILLMLALCGGSVAAQELPTYEDPAKKKEINEIKLSEQAVYADVIQLATDDQEAISLSQQKSIGLLQTHIIEIFAKRMNMSKEDVKEIWDVIDDKCQNIVVRKGDLFRVFTYIMKDAIGLGPKKPKTKDIAEYFGSDSLEVATADTASLKEEAHLLANVMTGSKDSINVLPPKPVEETPVTNQVVAQPAQTVVVVQQGGQTVDTEKAVQAAATTQAQTVVVVQAAQPAQTSNATEVVAAPAQTPQPVPAVEPAKVVTPVADVAVPDLCQEMLDKGNYSALMKYLKQQKTYQKLMYGGLNTMQYPGKCYIVIVDKGTYNVVTVLDKGDKDRMNFVTKQMDNFRNYRNGNYAAIFVQEY